jgi:hypothetical protein
MRIAGDRHLKLARALAVAALVTAVAALACGASAVAAGAPGACSWAGETDQRDVNIGAPDLDAYYWLHALSPQPGTQVEIAGSYPRARYFSFHVYDAQGNALTSIYDRQIDPDPHSANPYRARPPRGAGDNYTLHVEFETKPAHPAANTLYVDPSSTGAAAELVYRIYVPQHPSQPSGDVPFPQVTVASASGQPLLGDGSCSTTPPPFGSTLWSHDAASDYPSIAPTPKIAAATRIPAWQRSFGNQLGNQQNAYLVTTISRQYGELVVIHTRAPTFPNTRAGQPAYGKYQLRYWSFCTYDQNGQAAIGCAADYGAAIRSGSITYVVSDPGVRPAHATAAQGVTWLPWGGAQSAAQLVYRNMLPAAGFTHAAERITPTANPQAVMGAYYPQAVYCALKTFERTGWRGCFRAAGIAVPKSSPPSHSRASRTRRCRDRHPRGHRSAHVRCSR